MAKKLITILVAITIIACSSISVFADDADINGANTNQTTTQTTVTKETKQQKQIKGIAAYIRSVNRSVNATRAKSLATSFVEIANKQNVDVYYLLAIAKNESNFNTRAKAAGGKYRGLMQTSTSLGKSYGYSPNALYTGKNSITVGAKCLKSNLKMFKNNYKKAVSGYAYGSYAVKKGKYSLHYYNTFNSNKTKIVNYLKKNKYI